MPYFVCVIVVVFSVRNSGKTELKPEGGVAVITIAFGLKTLHIFSWSCLGLGLVGPGNWGFKIAGRAAKMFLAEKKCG